MGPHLLLFAALVLRDTLALSSGVSEGLRLEVCPNGLGEVSFDGPNDAALLGSLVQGQTGLLLRSHRKRVFWSANELSDEEALKSEAEALASLKLATPTVAVADGLASGFGAKVFAACDYRVATSQTVFETPETQLGFVPEFKCLSKAFPREVALFIALTGYRLTGRDLLDCGIATHFCRDGRGPELAVELRHAPTDFLDVCLDRNCQPHPPNALASPLFATGSAPVLRGVLDRVFSDTSSVADIAQRLRGEQDIAEKAAESSAWRVRELAEPVLDVLNDALDVIHFKSSPLALEATFQLMTQSNVPASDDDLLAVNTRLRRRHRDHSSSSSSTAQRNRHKNPWAGTTLAEARPLARDLLSDVLGS